MTLDRKGIATAIKDLLKADTGTLYGTGKLLQIIEPKPIYFTKAKVNNNNPYALYLWVDTQDTVEERMQNGDVNYTVDMRFEGLSVDPETAVQKIDDALERVSVLVNNEMRTGQNLSSYYTDSNAQVIDMVPISSSLPPPLSENKGKVTIEIEGAYNILVNRWS